MVAYQVYSGDTNKHGFQTYELKATFLDKQKAEELALGIVASTPLFGDTLEETVWINKAKYWNALGWDTVTICKINEIEITE